MPGVAILFVALAISVGTGMFRRVKGQKITTGITVSVSHPYDPGESRPTFFACVEYEVNGKVYNVTSRIRAASYHPGQKRKVAFNKDAPEDSFVMPTTANYLVVVLIALFGVIVMTQTI